MHQSDTQKRLTECVGFGSYGFDMWRSGLSDSVAQIGLNNDASVQEKKAQLKQSA